MSCVAGSTWTISPPLAAMRRPANLGNSVRLGRPTLGERELAILLRDLEDPFAIRIRRGLAQPAKPRERRAGARPVRPLARRRSTGRSPAPAARAAPTATRFPIPSSTSSSSRVGSAPVASTGRFRAASAVVASKNSASEISDIRSATRNTSGPRGRTPMPISGWRRPSSVSSGWIVRSSWRAPNQSSTLGSRDPAATTSIAQPSRVAAAPTPTSWVLPAARSRKNADASTISTMPMVKTNRARPRRLRLE